MSKSSEEYSFPGELDVEETAADRRWDVFWSESSICQSHSTAPTYWDEAKKG